MGIKLFGFLIFTTICLVAISCDDGEGRREIERPCLTREDLAATGCVALNIFLPPGLCEPLECVSETMEFTLPPGEQADCDVPETCDSLGCNNARLVFTGLKINEEGNVVGILIFNVDEFSEPFVCF